MWWIIILVIIALLLVLLIVVIIVSKKDNPQKYDWVYLPFYQKMRHLGRNPPKYARYLADKYEAKSLVKEKCPKINIAKIVYFTSDPNLPELSTILEPGKSYMMKANNASKRNKKITISSNRDKLNQTIKRWLETPFKTANTDEKQYGQMKPMAIIEELITDVEYEYRIYCFHGKPHYLRVKRINEISLSYYTSDWEKTEIGHIYTPKSKYIPKPAYLDQLLIYTEQLCKGIAFVCVDLMITKNGDIYFCEYTFTPHNSNRILVPDKYQEIFSNLWRYRDE